VTTRREFIKSAATLGGLPALTSLGLHGALLADGTEGALPEFKLPPLPYLPEALEPHLDGRTLRIHQMKQHALHVVRLNAALRQLHATRRR
jgi:Fe-Mn family superoxide dismutase